MSRISHASLKCRQCGGLAPATRRTCPICGSTLRAPSRLLPIAGGLALAGLAGLGGAMLWSVPHLLRDSAGFEARALQASGTVLSAERRESKEQIGGRSIFLYYAVVRFRDAGGRFHTFHAGASRKPLVGGDAVGVFYDPTEPSRASLHRPTGSRNRAALFGAIGLALVVLGLGGIYGLARRLGSLVAGAALD